MKKLFVLFLIIVSPVCTNADTIFFKNGTRLDIPKAWRTEGFVHCEIYGAQVRYPEQEVARIVTGPLKNDPEGKNRQSDNKSLGRESDRALLHDPDNDRPDSESRGHDLNERALEQAREGAWRKAIDYAEEALRLFPGNQTIRRNLAGFYNSYALMLRREGMYEQALQNLHQALDYMPDRSEIKKNMAVTYVNLAYQDFNRRDFAACKTRLEKAGFYDERNPHVSILYGKIAYNNGNYVKARQHWSRALALEPGLGQVQALLNKLQKESTLEEDFDTKSTGSFTVKFEGSENRVLADDVVRVLREAYDDVGRDLDLYPKGEIPVIVYPRSDLPQLEYFPDWAAGIYDGKIRFGEDLWHKQQYMTSVLYHEYTHALVFILAGRNVPLWLNEGLAEYEARHFHYSAKRSSRQKLLRKSARRKSLLPLASLTSLSLAVMSRLAPQNIPLVYAQSESFVTYLIERNSLADMRAVLARLGKGETAETAIRHILHEDPATLEENWRKTFQE